MQQAKERKTMNTLFTVIGLFFFQQFVIIGFDILQRINYYEIEEVDPEEASCYI